MEFMRNTDLNFFIQYQGGKKMMKKEEIATAYIFKNGKSSIVPLYDYSELKIVDEVLNQAKKKEKNTLNRFF